MSLDIDLMEPSETTYAINSIYDANITHNLGKMAQEAGIYMVLWRPDEIHKTIAGDIIEILEKGLKDLKARPTYFKQFDDPNGWGTYKHFIPFVEKYLEACKKYPKAIIEVDK